MRSRDGTEALVLARIAGSEDEVRDRNGTPYFLRILPYRVKHETGGRQAGLSTADHDGIDVLGRFSNYPLHYLDHLSLQLI